MDNKKNSQAKTNTNAKANTSSKTNSVEFADELETTNMPYGNQEIGKGSKKSNSKDNCK